MDAQNKQKTSEAPSLEISGSNDAVQNNEKDVDKEDINIQASSPLNTGKRSLKKLDRNFTVGQIEPAIPKVT